MCVGANGTSNAVSKPDEDRRFEATALIWLKAFDPGGKKRLVDIAEAWSICPNAQPSAAAIRSPARRASANHSNARARSGIGSLYRAERINQRRSTAFPQLTRNVFLAMRLNFGNVASQLPMRLPQSARKLGVMLVGCAS